MQTTPRTTKPYPTLSQLLHNQTRPNSVCYLISTQLEDSCQKNWVTPPPQKKKKKSKNKIWFWTNSKLNSTKFSMPPYFISTPTRKFMHRTIISFVQPQPNSIQNKNNPIGCGTAPGNLLCPYFVSRNRKSFASTTMAMWN